MNGITQKAHQQIVTRLEEVLPGIIDNLLAKETGPLEEEIASLKKMFNEAQDAIVTADAKTAEEQRLRVAAENQLADAESKLAALNRLAEAKEAELAKAAATIALATAKLNERDLAIDSLKAEPSTARTNG